MPRYEVFLKPGYGSADIEADNPQQAAAMFAESLAADLGPECIETNCLDDEPDNTSPITPITPITAGCGA